MHTEQIFNFLSGVTPLSAGLKEALSGHLKQEVYKSRQILQATGQQESRLWYTASGFARSYYYDDEGKEYTVKFWKEQDFIFSYQGFWKEPSGFYIEILEPAVLISLSYLHLDGLLASYPEANVIFHTILRRHYIEEQGRIKLLALPAEERYLLLRKKSPFLFQRTSLRLIASYLNMSRESLSRIISRENY